MGRKLYVGNLPYQTGETELTELFSRAGTVESARIMRDMATGRARGFGFVEMASDEEAQRAITELNEFKMEGRRLSSTRRGPSRWVAGVVVVAASSAAIAVAAAGAAAGVNRGGRNAGS